MFDSSVVVDPAQVYPDLTAAIDALPTRAVRGGTAIDAQIRVRALAVLARRVEALLLAEVAGFDDQGFAAACGARSTGGFLSAHTHLDPGSSARLVLAARTADRMPQLGAMLAAGDIGVEHVAAVGYATRRLPQEVVTGEDATFATLAASARPSQLRVAGLHLQSLYDADAVAKNARHVRESRYLTLSQTIDDAWHLEGLLTAEDGTALAVALEALMAPGGEEDTRTVTQRRADALVELAELGLRSAALPDCGGDRPRVTLIVQAGRNPFDHSADDQPAPGGLTTLRHGLHDLVGAATGTGAGGTYGQLGVSAGGGDGDLTDVDSADHPQTTPGAVQLGVTAFNHGDAQLLAASGMIPAETLARICCEADLNLATLDATRQMLNRGRTTRYPNVYQRRGVILRDRHCVFPGCDIPPGRCQVHHLRFWKRHKGRTDLNNLALVCHFHHRLIHDDHWTLAADPPSPQNPEAAGSPPHPTATNSDNTTPDPSTGLRRRIWADLPPLSGYVRMPRHPS